MGRSLTVACVLRSGAIYDATWVDRLRRGVARHLTLPHRFVCLSDCPVPCERIPLKHEWPGWWAKLELFRPGIWRDGERVLYLDLDTVITGDLVPIVRAPTQLAMLQDFRRDHILASGVMLWTGPVPSAPYDDYLRPRNRPSPKSRADHWLGARLPSCDRLQGLVDGTYCYKLHCKRGIPADARLVCMMRKPTLLDLAPDDPVRRTWEMAA